MPKKIGAALILIIFLALFYSFSRQVYDSLQAGSRLDLATDELTKLQQKNSELKKQLTEVQSPSFIEGQARDKLNLARTGETVVIIPDSAIEQVLGAGKTTEGPKLSNWQAWLRLFFKQ